MLNKTQSRPFWRLCFISVLWLAVGQADAANSESRFYPNDTQLIVSKAGTEVSRLECQRIRLKLPDDWKNQHVGASVGLAKDETLYAAVAGDAGTRLLVSANQGRTWNDYEVKLPEGKSMGAFTVLADGSLLGACRYGVGADESRRMVFYRSTDGGRKWTQRSEVLAAPFQQIYPDGNLLQLQDGTLLLPVHHRVNAPKGDPYPNAIYAGYIYRSNDGGKSWRSGASDAIWKILIKARFSLFDLGPDSRFPGMGGIFPGCYEMNLFQMPDGKVLAAYRYSGFNRYWHRNKVKEWGGDTAVKWDDDKDPWGLPGRRVFRNALLGESVDGGKSWQNLRPFLDPEGQPLLVYGESQGELLRLPDDRLVFIAQRRYPRHLGENVARVSEDGGRTWLRAEYHVNFGFGYSGSEVLKDGTIVTVTGVALCTLNDPASATKDAPLEGPPCSYARPEVQIIRWGLPEKK